jgi:uncharacterized protein
MSRTDVFDLGRLRLTAGEGRRLDLEVALRPLDFSGQRYEPDSPVAARLDISRMTGGGYSLRLRFAAALRGPCMRCLLDAEPVTEVDAREVDQPGGGEELSSPYLNGEEELDLQQWATDAYALALPAQIVCRPDCAGLCPECGANRNEDPGHAHEAPKDSRWAALDALKFD